MPENTEKPQNNPMKYTIATPLSGSSKFVGIRLPVEITDYMKARAGNNVSTVTAEIRSMLVDHLRDLGVMPPADKEAVK